MNILLINHYAGSPEMGMEFRPYYFAREWVKMGHRVCIMAADYSHLRMKNPRISHDFERQVIDNITYCWVKAGRYEKNGVRRALTMFRFVGKLWLRAGRIAKLWKPDVVITSSTYPLDTYAGQRIAGKCRAKLIHEVHDMWPITPVEINGMSKHHPFIMALQLAENSFCRKSDKVVSLLPNAKAYFMAHGMEEKKFVWVPNGIAADEWEKTEDLPEKTRALIEHMRNEHEFLLCFFGSHTKSYALEYLIEAAGAFDYRKIGVVLVGDGSDKKRLAEKSSRYRNIYFSDPVPKRCIPSLLEAVDGIYVGAVNNRMFRFGICMNKLFDSMMSGKPILYAVNAPNNYIEQYGCGISVEAENTQALKEGIEKLLCTSGEELRRMGQNGREAVLEHFQYERLAETFLKL